MFPASPQILALTGLAARGSFARLLTSAKPPFSQGATVLQLSFTFKRPGGGDREVPPQPEPDVDRATEAYAKASEWSAVLAKRVGRRVRLVITDNRRTMLSAADKAGRMEVRMHHMFLAGGHEMLEAVSRYLTSNDRRASRKIDDFIEANKVRLTDSAGRSVSIRTEGKCHDLQQIFNDLSARHFGGPLDVRITWGRRVRPRRGQRSLQMGTYVPDEKLIRIHPVLDQAWVPRFFVEAVVFHEMLHHDMGSIEKNGRHHFHTRAFRKRERSFEYYAAAQRWEKDNFRRLLRG